MRAEVFALATSTIAAWGLFGLFGKLAVERLFGSGGRTDRRDVVHLRYRDQDRADVAERGGDLVGNCRLLSMGPTPPS